MVSRQKRRRQLARAKYERRQQRWVQGRARTRKRNTIVASALAVVVLGGGASWAGVKFTEDDSPHTTAVTSPSAPASPAQVQGCDFAQATDNPSNAHWEKEPALTIDRAAAYTASLKTNCGLITLALDARKAPHTVNSFVFLAGKRYFDHSHCHRLTTQGIYVLQCGDPSGTGSGGPGYTIPDENLEGATYPAGTVAMANTGQKHTGGSQFFLVYKDTQLPAQYTPFGRITDGLDVIRQIADGGVQGGGTDGTPNVTVVIKSVTTSRK